MCVASLTHSPGSASWRANPANWKRCLEVGQCPLWVKSGHHTRSARHVRFTVPKADIRPLIRSTHRRVAGAVQARVWLFSGMRQSRPFNFARQNRRYDVLEKLNLFATKFGDIQKESREVASRARQAVDPSVRHGIAFQVDPDDRDRAGGFHYGSNRIWTSDEDNAAFEGNKLTGEFVNSFERVVVIPRIQNNILAVHIPSLAQPLAERLGIFDCGR